jgi:hypothetical protein
MSKANDNSATDPLYSKIMAPSGNVVSGGAGLLVRAKAVGGPSNLVAIGIKAALDASNQAVVQHHRQKLRAVS